MTFCPDDQTNPSLRVVFCARKFLSSGRQRDNKKAFKVLGQKKLITHARHSLTLLFCAWCLVFCIRGRLWWFLAHASLSDDAKRIHSISYDSLPRLDVFCGGLVITKLQETFVLS